MSIFSEIIKYIEFDTSFKNGGLFQYILSWVLLIPMGILCYFFDESAFKDYIYLWILWIYLFGFIHKHFRAVLMISFYFIEMILIIRIFL